MTGEEGVGKLTILNLFPSENILEIDLDLNEILKKQIDILDLKNVEQCILRVIDLKELIKNIVSYKNLLNSIDFVCIVTNSTLSNIDTTRELKSKLKQEFSDVDYYIIANFQDRKGTALEVEKIEELLEEKTFGFSAVQKDSNQRIISIIKDILRISILERDEKNYLISEFDEIWSEIDKARVSETRGDKLAAAKIFSNTASQLKKFSSDILFKDKKEEINAIYYLCNAWENLAYAEELKEGAKFSEAANHFTQASELIHDSKLKLLALGNSEFCKALQLGLEFEKSKEININSDNYLKIKAILNKVADLYRKGGFETEANWALATSDYFTESMNELKNT